MIEAALHNHLISQPELSKQLATYSCHPAVFNQYAPADTDPRWGRGSQYGRIIFAVDLRGDPERIVGGQLAVDIMCKRNNKLPEDIEPIVRKLIHGYFFSKGTFVVAAQFKNSQYFSQQKDDVSGCTLTFDLLAFPVLSHGELDVLPRFNEWTSQFDGIYVINRDSLPSTAWKPAQHETAVYWRVQRVSPTGRIPDTQSTIWRTAIVKGHIFAEDIATATAVANALVYKLYCDKWLRKEGASPIRVDDKNTIDVGADPLKTGQITVEATYGLVRRFMTDDTINHINREFQ